MKKKAELSLGQVQQGGTKKREQAHRRFEDADNALCLRKQVETARKFGNPDMQMPHGSISALRPPLPAGAGDRS
jgi:hypothetical protein